MEYRILGESDLKVSAIAFGAWAIGGWKWGGTDVKAAINGIHAGIDEGMTTIDTAPVYGFGLSEEIVGDALKGKPRDKIQVLTKFGLRWDLSKGLLHIKGTAEEKFKDVYKYAGKDSVIEECEQSLKRLQTDYIDLFQIHWPDATTPIGETMEALALLKKQGKIREAAVCNYSVEEMEEASKYINLVSNQIPYSMLLRDAEKELIPYCIAHKKSILAYSPMQRGILTGKFKPDHQFKGDDHRPDTKFYTPENIKRVNAFLDEINPLAEQHKATLSQLVLRWTIDQPGVTVALAGSRNPAQAIQNAKAARIKLTAGELEQINAALGELELVSPGKAK